MILVTGGTGLVGAHYCCTSFIDNGQSRVRATYRSLVLLKKPNRYLTAIIKDLFDKSTGPKQIFLIFLL
jgi:uncharacterized protein YbjT (DUF2867 family)